MVVGGDGGGGQRANVGIRGKEGKEEKELVADRGIAAMEQHALAVRSCVGGSVALYGVEHTTNEYGEKIKAQQTDL